MFSCGIRNGHRAMLFIRFNPRVTQPLSLNVELQSKRLICNSHIDNIQARLLHADFSFQIVMSYRQISESIALIPCFSRQRQ